MSGILQVRVCGEGAAQAVPLPGSCPDKSESLGFPQVGMKFDIVTQWMIAYVVRHIPLCRACSDVGEDGVND